MSTPPCCLLLHGSLYRLEQTSSTTLQVTSLQPESSSRASDLLVTSGSDKDGDHYGASSSDSEDEALVEMQSTGRRPSTNYRPEFAAKTLAQARNSVLFPVDLFFFSSFPCFWCMAWARRPSAVSCVFLLLLLFFCVLLPRHWQRRKVLMLFSC